MKKNTVVIPLRAYRFFGIEDNKTKEMNTWYIKNLSVKKFL